MINRLFNSKRIVSAKFLFGSILLTVPILLITALLFILFPRIGLGFMGKIASDTATVGFGDEVVLGDLDIVRLEETVVMRLVPKGHQDRRPARIDMRLKGAVFDDFDGEKWRKAIQPKWMTLAGDGTTFFIQDERNAPVLGRYDALLEPMTPKLLFTPEGTGRIHLEPTAGRGGIVPRKIGANLYGEIRYEDAAGVGIQYSIDVTGAPPIGAPPVLSLSGYAIA